MNLKSLPKTSQMLAVIANIIFLCYLTIYASAQPSAPLVAAVAFEIIFFISLIGYRRWRSQTTSALKAETALQSIEEAHRSIYLIRRALAGLGIAIFGCACLYMTVDVAALLPARFGRPDLSKPIYMAIAPPIALGVHPAFSMELLAGAYIDARRFPQAEPLLLELLDIRRHVAGEQSELVAAMYANLGDFCRKCSKNQAAENFYNRSIALSQKLNLPQGYGSPMTKLGALLRDESKFEQSEKALRDALAVRQKIFGKNSTKVAETLIEYAQLMQAEHRPQEASSMQQQADFINQAHQAESGVRPIDAAPLVVLGFSLLFFSQRDKLIVFIANWSKRRRLANAPPAE